MLSWIWKILPSEWKFSVASKKFAWTLGKTIAALLAGTKIGKEVSPEQWEVVAGISTTLIAGGFKFVHDWAKLKFPALSKYL